MKKDKNNINSDLVTKKYLDNKLDVTKKHLDDKLEVTKKHLEDKIEDTKKHFDDKLAKNTFEIINYVDMKFISVDEKFEKIDKKLEMLDDILKTLDWLAKDYKDLKDENTINAEQSRRLDDRVITLEKRLFASV